MRKPHTPYQSGLVSILTVLMFSILVGVLLTGFTRLMIQERRDTLQDALSKSAYNSAQAGVEDAKRAIEACAKGVPGIDCSNAGLYRQDCPGFNAVSPGFGSGAFAAIGIPAPSGNGSAVGEPGANQRYTCVTISRSGDIVTQLGDESSTTNTAMYELLATNPYDTIVFSWHSSAQDGTAVLPPLSSVNNDAGGQKGNKRKPEWKDANGISYPAVLRVNVIDVDGNYNPTSSSRFIYPTSDGSTSAISGISHFQKCDPNSDSTYRCSASLQVPSTNKRFVVVQPLYRGTKVRVSVKNGSTDVALSGPQLTIDSTGVTEQVFRRVQTRVTMTSGPLASSTALDTGYGVCKDFFVSVGTFEDYCNPADP